MRGQHHVVKVLGAAVGGHAHAALVAVMRRTGVFRRLSAMRATIFST
jgi:hypothetical protein